MSYSTRIDDAVYVPPTAAAIATLLMTQNWLALLAYHPNKQLTEFFTTGISQGFRICFDAPQSTLRSASQNLACALQHPEVFDRYLSEELVHHWVAGPFHTAWGLHVHARKFRVISIPCRPTLSSHALEESNLTTLWTGISPATL